MKRNIFYNSIAMAVIKYIMKQHKVSVRKYFFVLLAFIALNACENSVAPPTEPEVRERGFVFSAQKKATFTPEQIGQILAYYGLEHDLQFSYTVNVFKIEYQTITAAGTPVHASGALMVPQTSDPVPLLSLQHGTVTGRNEVASVNPLNSVEGIVGVMTAALGYLSNVPDYTGYGVSNMLHPYVHARSLALAVIDMLRATRNYMQNTSIALADQIYLTGYSEGGYATLAAQKEIEENYAGEFQLTAVAPMAGPYDLAGTVETILQQQYYDHPCYVAFLLTAYNNIYGWNRLNEIFMAPYAAMMPGLFNGSKSYAEINELLPAEIRDLVTAEFIDGYLAGTEPDVMNAVVENTLLDWSPVTPIRFFHGNADEAVPFSNAISAIENLSAQSDASIELVTIEGGTHASAGIPAILGMIDWFENISSGSGNNTPFPSRQLTADL